MGKSAISYKLCRGCGKVIRHGEIQLDGKAYCRTCGLGKMAKKTSAMEV